MSGILLEANRIQKTFGEQTVLDIDRVQIRDGERIALIGENGAGKSTLLAILAGEMEPDGGTVRRFCPVAFIRQSGEARLDGNARMASEFRAPQKREGLSGGERTRRRISEALSDDAQLLLADEPTTDLDEDGVRRLTRQLLSFRGALVLVSHDRALMNEVCTRVLHLEDGKIRDFPGTYASYQEELERQREFQQFEYDQYRAEKARLKAQIQQKTEWASSVRKAPSRMGNSEARLHTREYTNAVLHLSASKRVVENRLDRLEKKERPRDLPEIRMALGASGKIGARNALSVACDTLMAGDKVLLADTGFVLPAGSRSALTGANGAGKTTLLRLLRGEQSDGIFFAGEVRLNPAAKIGWFDQDHEKSLDLRRTALENAMSETRHSESDARTVLARLNLAGDQVFKPVRVLSGGERAKIALAKLLLSESNLLILDEPTNHLDVFTMEALEKLLSAYAGTLLFVSHDRTFVSSVATRILTIRDGALHTFEGTLAQRDADSARDRDSEGVRLEIAVLEMRLAALADRMSAPRKGDRPDRLAEEYNALAEEVRRRKQTE